jgi:hypothetical protein
MNPLWRIHTLWRFDHGSRFDAIGTNHHFFDPAVRNRPHPLKIGIESAFGDIVGVTDIVAHHGFFSAYFTYL